jgi:hypothetical protein
MDAQRLASLVRASINRALTNLEKTDRMTTSTFVFRQLAVRGLSLLIGCAGFAVSTVASTVTAAEPVIIITKNDCARLVSHQPSPDVTYKPGVDVHGQPVAPADVPGSPQIAMPEEIAVDLTVEIQRRFGIPDDSALFKPDVRVGTVVVKPDGSATFDGQPLTTPEQQALSALCQTEGTAAAR